MKSNLDSSDHHQIPSVAAPSVAPIQNDANFSLGKNIPAMTYCYFSHSIVALSWTVMLEMMSESGMIQTALAYMDTFASLQQVLSIMLLPTLHIVMINRKLLNTNLLSSMEIVTST